MVGSLDVKGVGLKMMSLAQTRPGGGHGCGRDRQLAWMPWGGAIAMVAIACGGPAAQAQIAPGDPGPVAPGQPMTVISDVQEANSITGTITARGNVQVDYPARQLQATSAQAQYFSQERRLILSGDVYVLQDGNTLRAETVTYLVDEGHMVALPLPERQVESVYLVPDTAAVTTAPAGAPFNPKPAFKAPESTQPVSPFGVPF